MNLTPASLKTPRHQDLKNQFLLSFASLRLCVKFPHRK